jgi:hypothetical protein
MLEPGIAYQEIAEFIPVWDIILKRAIVSFIIGINAFIEKLGPEAFFKPW